MAAATLRGAALLDAVKPEILRLYETAPAFGTLTFSVVFHEGRLVRVSYGADIQQQVKR